MEQFYFSMNASRKMASRSRAGSTIVRKIITGLTTLRRIWAPFSNLTTMAKKIWRQVKSLLIRTGTNSLVRRHITKSCKAGSASVTSLRSRRTRWEFNMSLKVPSWLKLTRNKLRMEVAAFSTKAPSRQATWAPSKESQVLVALETLENDSTRANFINKMMKVSFMPRNSILMKTTRRRTRMERRATSKLVAKQVLKMEWWK